MKKRIIVFILVLTMMCSFTMTACDFFGGGGNDGNNKLKVFSVSYFVEHVESHEEFVEEGSSIYLYQPTKSGDYTFDGWYENSDYSGTKYADNDVYTPTKDVKFYGRFLEHTFPLEHISQIDPTCDYDGKRACYKCSNCESYFLDAEAKQQINYDRDISIPETGNHPYSSEYSYNGVTHRRYADCDEYWAYTDLGVHDTNGEDGACSVCGFKSTGEPTSGLKFKLDSYRSGYIVTGIENAEGIDTLVIPAEYDGKPVTGIENGAFGNECGHVSAIILPATVKSIGSGAFKGMYDTFDLAYAGTLEQWFDISFGQFASGTFRLIIGGENIVNITIPNSITSIDEYIFKLENIETITFGSNVKNINNYLSSFNIGKINFTGSIEDWFGISIKRFIFGENTELYIDGKLVTEITVPQSVTRIENYFFKNYTKLTKLTLHSGVTEIGLSAFQDCKALEKIDGADGLLNIEGYAFIRCTSLVSVNGTTQLRTIGGYAFNECTALEHFTIPESVTQIGDLCFKDCKNLYTVEGGICYLDNWAIDRQLTTSDDGFAVIRPGTVGISDYLLVRSIIKEITIPGSLKYMGIGAFSENAYLQKATIESGVKELSDSAFRGCSVLEKIVLPDTLTSIGKYALSETALTSVVIPENVTMMGEGVLFGCKNLESAKLPNYIRVLPNRVFEGCTSLTTVEIGEFEEIGYQAFKSCDKLSEITLPTACIKIGEYAFDNCGALTKVHYIGTEELWNNVNVGEGNDALKGIVLFEPPVG